MTLAKWILALLFPLALHQTARSAVTVMPGQPVEVDDSLVVIGDSLNPNGIAYVLDRPGSTLSFGIFSSYYGHEVTPLNALTGTHTVTSATDFELPLETALELSAGEYWLIAFATVPASPGTTDAIGYLSMPFSIEQDLVITAIGVTHSEGSHVYLVASPIPEPSLPILLAITTPLLFIRKKRSPRHP